MTDLIKTAVAMAGANVRTVTLTHRAHKTVNIATLAVQTLVRMIFGAMKPSSGVSLQ